MSVPDAVELSPQKWALARYSSYTLLSRLLLEGISAELLPYIKAIPNLPSIKFDADQLAAEHQQVFGFNVFPNESIFLDTTGLLGGIQADDIQRTYQKNGYAVTDSPDHIGYQLGYLAFLSAAEADAWEDDRADIASQLGRRQRTFMCKHLLRWLPSFMVALRRQENAFYAALSDTIWLLVALHSESLEIDCAEDDFLPAPPDLLKQSGTSLKNIAEMLTMPAYSGWWLGQGGLSKIGRKYDLPRGFGNRIQTLMNLFRSAIQYEQVPALFKQMEEEAHEWDQIYQQLSEQAPILTPFVQVWRQRLQETVHFLSDVQRIVAKIEDDV